MPACISSLSQNTGNNSTTLDGWHEQATTTTIIEHFVDANAVVTFSTETALCITITVYQTLPTKAAPTFQNKLIDHA
jgi:hypothetical protein